MLDQKGLTKENICISVREMVNNARRNVNWSFVGSNHGCRKDIFSWVPEGNFPGRAKSGFFRDSEKKLLWGGQKWYNLIFPN